MVKFHGRPGERSIARQGESNFALDKNLREMADWEGGLTEKQMAERGKAAIKEMEERVLVEETGINYVGLVDWFRRKSPSAALLIYDIMGDKTVDVKWRLSAAELILKYAGYSPAVQVEVNVKSQIHTVLEDVMGKGSDGEMVDGEIEE
jgi:hypothetical protein